MNSFGFLFIIISHNLLNFKVIQENGNSIYLSN
jgi:hypothetical protein